MWIEFFCGLHSDFWAWIRLRIWVPRTTRAFPWVQIGQFCLLECQMEIWKIGVYLNGYCILHFSGTLLSILSCRVILIHEIYFRRQESIFGVLSLWNEQVFPFFWAPSPFCHSWMQLFDKWTFQSFKATFTVHFAWETKSKTPGPIFINEFKA